MSQPEKPTTALGIDLGTSGVRAAALAADGTLLDMAAFAFPDATAGRLPAMWWTGVQACLAALSARLSFATIEGVAVGTTSPAE